MAGRADHELAPSAERGDLSAYLSVGMLLPLLMLLAFGGAETVHLLGLRAAVSAVSYAALRSAESAGGVSPALGQQLADEVDTWTGGTAAAVTGTPPGQSWGNQVCLDVDAPLSLQLPALSSDVNLGGNFCGVSDLPPSGQ